MEDFVIIISLLAVFALGFIPVSFFSRFLNRIRKPVIDKSKGRTQDVYRKTEFEDDPVHEFERTGEVFFRRK